MPLRKPGKAQGEDGPTMIVGGVAMPWSEFNAMIDEMERRQKPFKSWIKRGIMPTYGKHLEKRLSKRTADGHWGVADIFFDRVLHVGFLDYEDIRAGFAFTEFPRWWNTHVVGMSMTVARVRTSVQKLSEFMLATYGVGMKGRRKS